MSWPMPSQSVKLLHQLVESCKQEPYIEIPIYGPNFCVLDAKHKLKVRNIKLRKIIHYLFGVLAGTTRI